MSQATYIQDMMADPAPDNSGLQEVASFYANRNVLVTGGVGFLGSLLIEKILRSCPDVKTLFVLLRAKKGKSPEERLRLLFEDTMFDRLRKEQPGYSRKVVLIVGDIAQVGLGLSKEHRELLRTTHIVIHAAATVRFDESLRVAVNINVRGTNELLSLAQEMENLKAFVHVSTAYSNCVQEVVEEKFYPTPIDGDKLLKLLDILDDASLEHLVPVLLGKWPNTYAYTKVIAEHSVRRSCHTLPVCMVRPSIVIATAKEPVPGWINNVYGATGIVLAVAVGLLHTLHCDPELVADMIPADYVVNTIIVAAWDIAKTRCINVDNEVNVMVPETEEVPIYNSVSSCQKPITWGQFMKHTSKLGLEIPSLVTVWIRFLRLNKYSWLHNIYVVFCHLLPAIIVDSLARLTGRKPVLWDAYKRIHKFSTVIRYFTLRQWRFSNNSVLRLWDKLSSADQSVFDFNVAGLNWEDYTYSHVRGIRVYLVKDPLDTLPAAAAKYTRIKIAHYTLLTAICGILLWLIWSLLRVIGLW
ncbi:fatty acyl-CoA reductase wat-like [Diprion similis]|uniref:fatty acyl-CoA reductase wat-like n=1 Tax=Diprion similis TaxID=362088 RepID=UPI001EF96968|nr:fatty acyl-CoA reductase wat-like [Diprion similis]XP_046742044.1 fatty acyl-CoA reductase wat-like [Diprion similis]XP_046742045.1 fatty acyl-CoA reductase wat-like [Diprion similis]